MKSSFFTIILVGLALLVSVAGCRTRAVVRYPAPTTSSAKSLPPGQAKKVYGHQSAKAFAPGQQKKSRAGYNQSNEGNGSKKQKGKNKK